MHMVMISDETQIQKFADWPASRAQSVAMAVTMTYSQRIWNLMSKKSLSTVQIKEKTLYVRRNKSRRDRLCTG